jgi:integrase
VPALGRRKLRTLSAEDVDQWLADESRECSTRTLRLLHSIPSRSIRRAQARDKVRRNVVLLCDVPTGRKGRASKALTLNQAIAIMTAATQSRLSPYIVLSLLTGARTEELRPLRWHDVDLLGNPEAVPPIPPLSRYCGPCVPGVRRSPGAPVALWPCRSGASTRSPPLG